MGAVAESGREGAPVYSYVKSRGLYAGISILGQVFVGQYRLSISHSMSSSRSIPLDIERFDENAAMYHWPGVKAQDVVSTRTEAYLHGLCTDKSAYQLTGKVRVPREAAGLMEALKNAETGKAQVEKGDGLEYVEPSSVDQLDLHEGVS